MTCFAARVEISRNARASGSCVSNGTGRERVPADQHDLVRGRVTNRSAAPPTVRRSLGMLAFARDARD